MRKDIGTPSTRIKALDFLGKEKGDFVVTYCKRFGFPIDDAIQAAYLFTPRSRNGLKKKEKAGDKTQQELWECAFASFMKREYSRLGGSNAPNLHMLTSVDENEETHHLTDPLNLNPLNILILQENLGDISGEMVKVESKSLAADLGCTQRRAQQLIKKIKELAEVQGDLFGGFGGVTE